MIATVLLIDQMVQDVNTCITFEEDYWAEATIEALNWSGPEFGWSIGEIRKHLAAFATHYLPEIERQISLAQQSGMPSKAQFRSNPELADFFQSLSFEGLDYMESIGHFRDKDFSIGKDYLIKAPPSFISIQHQLITLLEAARTVDIGAIQIPALIVDNAFFSLGDCFQFLIKHQILHFEQAFICMDAYEAELEQAVL